MFIKTDNNTTGYIKIFSLINLYYFQINKANK